MFRRAVPAIGVVAAAFVLSFALAPRSLWGHDPGISYQVAHSMVHEGSFRVYDDPLNINKPYASYGIGMSLFMTVAELVGPHVNASPGGLDTLINPALLALIALVMWLTLRRMGASPAQASATSLIVALTSPLLPYATSSFSEIGTALGVALGVWGLIIARDRALLGGVIAGLGAGLAGLMRTDSFLLIAPVVAVGAALAARHRWRAIAGIAAGAAPAVGFTAWYNAYRFGSPLTTQYAGLPLSDSFPYPFLNGLYGLVASPGRGLLLYAPVTLLVAVAWRWAWRRSPLLAVVSLVLIVDRLFFYASWWAWHGGVGWGPRFLVPALPALAPFVLEVVRRLPRPRTIARTIGVAGVAVLLGVSFGIQIVGSVTDPGNDRLASEVNRRADAVPKTDPRYMVNAVKPPMLAAWSDPMFDWSLSPIVDHTQAAAGGRNLTSRFLKPSVATLPLAVAGVLVLGGLVLALVPVRRRPIVEPAIAAVET